MNWLRWYHGTVNDPKWRAIARAIGQPVHIIVSVWAAMLENVSDSPKRGTLENWSSEDAGIVLDLPTETVETVCNAMKRRGLFHANSDTLAAWDKRNPKRERKDSSTERVQRFREKKRNETAVKRNETDVTETAFHETDVTNVTFGNGDETDSELQFDDPVEDAGRRKRHETPSNATKRPDKIRIDKRRIDKKEEKKGSPPTEKRVGRNDPAAEMFKAKYLENIRNPYEWRAGDFPQMDKLRKRLDLRHDETPLDWEVGLSNYFGTPFAEFSLQHFASKFDTFKNSQLDRFHVPTNHKGNNHGPEKESHGERVARKNREMAAQFDHELFGANGDRDGQGSPEGESTALLPRPK